MPVSDKTTLKELKALIKDHAKSLPKLSAGKTALTIYAEKAGLLKRKEEAPVTTMEPKKKAELPEALKKPVKMATSEVPEALKKPVKAKVAVKEAPVPVKKAATGFAAFMSQNKGQGLSMSQLSQMYREGKEQ